jgi:hypothetical protein
MKVIGNPVGITIHPTPYIPVSVWFLLVLMSLDPIEVSPQSRYVHLTSEVGNDVDIVRDSSPPQKLSLDSIHMSNSSFAVTTLNNLTGRCNIVKLAKMVKEFINHSNAEQLCLH